MLAPFHNRAYWQIAVVFALAILVAGPVSAQTARSPFGKRLATTPPRGWNSFNCYGVYLHEKAALANLEAMAKKLKSHGYEYFVIDNGWFGEYRLRPGTIYAAEKHAHDVRIDRYGHFLPSKTYFPNGFDALVTRCHELGLKFGVHLMRGIPRKACEMNLPIQGTSYKASEIANTDPAVNCKWCTYNYGVDMSKPGAQEWYDGLIQHMADMGVDFIKYDDIVPYPREVEAVARAIRKTGRPIVLSLSPGGSVDPNAIGSFRTANMLRVTKDIWDEQSDIDECFAAWRRWGGKERPGFWIDMDMICFGQLQLMSPPGKQKDPMQKGDIALAGKGTRRWSQLDDAQRRTFITLRALAASPLMVGGDLPTLDDYSLSLLTNPSMLACNQNGVMADLVDEKDSVETWRVFVRGSSDTGFAGIFNRSETPRIVEITPARLAVKSAERIELHDVWADRRLAASAAKPFRVTIGPHDVLFVRFRPTR